jgi:SAM-dependent methyltransferase
MPDKTPLPAVAWPRYGVDAPAFPAVLGAAGVAFCLAAARRRPGRIALAATGTLLLANAGVYLHTTLRGKLRAWERELDRVGLRGDEQLLDLGCGRGAVLIAAATRLPEGRAVGADRWTRDQSGNRPEVTLANAAAAGVAGRVEVHTADITALPFPDGSFDVVTSAMAIHNIRSPGERYRAVDEAMRVLRPGGQLLIADPWPMARMYAAHIGRGTLRGLGPGYWYGGPWLGVTLLHAVKDRVPIPISSCGQPRLRRRASAGGFTQRELPESWAWPVSTTCLAISPVANWSRFAMAIGRSALPPARSSGRCGSRR